MESKDKSNKLAVMQLRHAEFDFMINTSKGANKIISDPMAASKQHPSDLYYHEMPKEDNTQTSLAS